VRFRLAMSIGLAAAVVLSVFLMVRSDSNAIADNTEFVSPSISPTTADTSQLLTLSDPNSALALSGDSGESSDTNMQASQPQPEQTPEPIYVYPDGSPAPPPSENSNDQYGTLYGEWDDDDDREYEEHDDDRYEREHHNDDDDHDRYEQDHHDGDYDDDWFSPSSLEKLAQRLFTTDDEHDDDHDDDDDDHHYHEEHDDD